jgi:hypothetical protein
VAEDENKKTALDEEEKTDQTLEDTSEDESEDLSDEAIDKELDSLENKEEVKLEKEQLENLLKAIKAVEEEKKKRKKGSKPPLIAIEFGMAFHRNLILNFLAYYTINLLVIYSVIEGFGFGTFSNLYAVLLFVLAYTVTEYIFRIYILLNHIQFVIRTFGFIFYFGYLTLFYIIDVYLFPNSVSFITETLFVVFVGMFVVFRYLLTQVIKNIMVRIG